MQDRGGERADDWRRRGSMMMEHTVRQRPAGRGAEQRGADAAAVVPARAGGDAIAEDEEQPSEEVEIEEVEVKGSFNAFVYALVTFNVAMTVTTWTLALIGERNGWEPRWVVGVRGWGWGRRLAYVNRFGLRT